ncbi:MAG: stage II sporulation protein M, partial [Deltaproteobacteria bacterium]
GMLGGVPTVLLHLYNGIVLGAFAAIFFRDPLPLAFLAWILPHGIPELTAITLCAAAGLCLGGAVAVPGRQGRRRALRDAVNPALLLFAGSLPLFALAALAESFVRESTLGTAARLGIAAVFAAGLAAALLAVRRFSRRVPVDAAWLGELIAPVRAGSPGSGSAPRP